MVTSRSGLFRCNGALNGVAFGGQSFSLVDVTAQDVDVASNPNSVLTFSPGFQGVMISLPHDITFESRTIVTTDRGTYNPTTIDLMKRVGFASSVFEGVFEVYSDDQVEARALLSPDFMERLIAFSREMLGHKIQCCFLGRQMHIVLDIDKSFQFAHDIVPSNFKRTKNVILSEVGTVCILLERLQALQASVGRRSLEAVSQDRKTYYLTQLEKISAYLQALPANQEWTHGMPAGMEDSHYLFCDSLKGLLYPRI